MNRNKLLKLGHIFTIFTPIKKIIDSKANKTELNKKVDKVNGKELSTNDYTTAEKDKLAGIAEGATKIQYVYENTLGRGRQCFNFSGNKASSDYSHAEGYNTTASGGNSHAEGYGTTASGNSSHAEGNDTKANGLNSHAEGYNTTASERGSHAEGSQTTASGMYSHAEGAFTKASGDYSHAEGGSATASGMYSHAEGQGNIASGKYSHAEGCQTKAMSAYQHVQGKLNTIDENEKYVHIVGNGTSINARSNAHTLDWNGLGWFANGLKVGGTSQDDEVARDVMLAPTTATVGQVIAVKTVDENDKPTEWEAVDMQGDINNIHELLSSGETGQVLSTTDNGVEWQNVTSDGGDSAGVVLWEDFSCTLSNGEVIPVDISPYSYVEATFKMASTNTSNYIYCTAGMHVGNVEGTLSGILCTALLTIDKVAIIAADAFLPYSEDAGGFTYKTNYVGDYVYTFGSGSITGTGTRATPTYPVRIVGYP